MDDLGQQALVLLRLSCGLSRSLAEAAQHCHREGRATTLGAYYLAEYYLHEAASWLALPPDDDWTGWQRRAAAGAAIIAVETQMRLATSVRRAETAACPDGSLPIRQWDIA